MDKRKIGAATLLASMPMAGLAAAGAAHAPLAQAPASAQWKTALGLDGWAAFFVTGAEMGCKVVTEGVGILACMMTGEF